MPSLMDIGKSAINAQRQALNVTGQNIANVNTDGYRRRDADLKEVPGSKANWLLNQPKLVLACRWEKCAAHLIRISFKVQTLQKVNFNLLQIL